MVKLMLNLHKFNNYAFFCPVSRLHLTVSSPVGYTNEVTPAILKAIKAKTVLDVDGVINLETGTINEDTKQVKNTETPAAPTEQTKSTETSEQNNGDTETKNPDNNLASETEEQPKTTKRGRGKAAKETE